MINLKKDVRKRIFFLIDKETGEKVRINTNTKFAYGLNIPYIDVTPPTENEKIFNDIYIPFQ